MKTPRAPYGVIPYDPIGAGILSRLKPADVKVYLVICAHANGESWEARPGLQRIKALTGLSLRAVQRAIRRLSAAGLVDVVTGCGRGNFTIFRLRGNGDRPFALCEGENGTPRSPYRSAKGDRQRPKKATSGDHIEQSEQRLPASAYPTRREIERAEREALEVGRDIR